MDSAQKQEFARRITNSNRGQMIVVLYDIFFTYAKEAQTGFGQGAGEGYKTALRRAQEVVARLRDSLDFNYPIAGELYPLYQFALKEMSSCFYKNNIDGLLAAEKVLRNLYAGFVEAARQDTSEPLVKHAQQVVAGMTYQKGNLTESLQDSDTSRGFFA